MPGGCPMRPQSSVVKVTWVLPGFQQQRLTGRIGDRPLSRSTGSRDRRVPDIG